MHKTQSFLRAALCAAFLSLFFLQGVPSHAATAPTPGVADQTAVAASPFDAGTWTVSPFTSYRAHELGQFNGKFGGGLALEYAPAQNVGIELNTVSESFDDSNWGDAFTEAGVNLKGYLPLGATGLAPYGFIGYTREIKEYGNRMNAGAGVAWRYKHVGVFVDGQWTHDFDTLGQALFRAGGSLSF